MPQSIHIVEDPEQHEELTGVTYLSPDEAEGRLVEFEIPGTMGKDIYRIDDVNLDDKVTMVSDVHSGREHMVEESVLPPAPDRFSCPRLGKEVTVMWKEHMNGRGEWVRTTPKTLGFYRPQTYHGRYRGHEQTRIVEKTFTYTPPGVLKLDIFIGEDGPTVPYEEDEITHIETVFDQIKTSEGHSTLGEVYINEDDEVIFYDIEKEHRVDSYLGPVKTLENYRI